jgi:hypothetical protein
MSSVLLSLALAGSAAAQIMVNGMSMVSVAASSSAVASSGGYYGSSAPAQATDSASATYGASSAEYTSPPSSSYDIYSMMPYDSMTAGGYSSLDCGYGYSKAYDGSCQSMSWVCGSLAGQALPLLKDLAVLLRGMLRDYHNQPVRFFPKIFHFAYFFFN